MKRCNGDGGGHAAVKGHSAVYEDGHGQSTTKG